MYGTLMICVNYNLAARNGYIAVAATAYIATAQHITSPISIDNSVFIHF